MSRTLDATGRAVKVSGRSLQRPRLLDLFCGAGGAAMGYHRAGFDVVGVDINPQPRYPFDFIQADALGFIADQWWPGSPHSHNGFDAIHASPPCQAFTVYKNHGRVKAAPNHIPATRDLLEQAGLPYVIENVETAADELRDPVMICGSSLGLDVRRHRLFETNFSLLVPSCAHGGQIPDRFPGGRSKGRTGSSRGLVRATMEIGTWDIPLSDQKRGMEIDWMTLEELSEAIPPAYTELIGHQLLAHIERQAREPEAVSPTLETGS